MFANKNHIWQASLGMLWLLAFNYPGEVNGANMLFFFPISTYSHRIPVWPLIERMVAKGHNVTFVSPFPPKEPNPKVTEFAPEAVKKFVEENEEGPVAVTMRERGEIPASWHVLNDWGLTLCDMFLKSPDTIEWLKTAKYDLVVIDGLYNDCGLGLAYKFGAPHMIFDTSSIFMWQYEAFGLPEESSWIPDMQYYFSGKMSYYERFWTVANRLYWHFDREYSYMPKLTEMLRTGLNLPDMPSVSEIEKNVSLVLMNSHYSEEFARALPPLVVPIGGMHLKEKSKPLPKDFEDFIAKSGDNGFIYISFGSAVQISLAPPRIAKAFFEATKRLSKINFLWKWEGEIPKDLPSNIFMSKWMPQQDILAHPKIKAFITHSGLMSIQEAVYNGVPVIGLPVFAEQDYNAERIHRVENGIRLEITTITADILEDAITKITSDPKYKKNMLQVSRRFKDRPTKPVDTAVWWTEFVLRHGDTSFLRPSSIYQSWFQRRLLDIYVPITVAVFFSIHILVFSIRFILKRFASGNAIPQNVKSKTS